jgi:hypothetical protein
MRKREAVYAFCFAESKNEPSSLSDTCITCWLLRTNVDGFLEKIKFGYFINEI